MSNSYATAWRLAIFSFVVAAFSGALMRYGMFAGMPAGLLLGDVRHAHSHLMFFAWVTPVVILLLSEAVRRSGTEFRAGAVIASAAAVAGLLAYVPFLLSGYRLLAIGDKELPLSMITSGLNGAVWYAFASFYLIVTWGRRRTTVLRFADGAVVSLVVASVGALLLGFEGMTGILDARHMDAFVDMFLTLFADGWFGLATIVGLLLTFFADALKSPRSARALSASAWLLTTGLVVRTVARLAVDAYGLDELAIVESVGAVLAGLAWLLVVGLLLSAVRRSHAAATKGSASASEPAAPDKLVALLVLLLLAVKAVFELAMALPAGEAFITREGLRIVLLHAFLLGVVSLALVSVMRSLFGPQVWPGLGAFAALVFVMLACLLPLTGLWPANLSGPWALRTAFYSSLGPATAGLLALLFGRSGQGAASERGTVRSEAPSPRRSQA